MLSVLRRLCGHVATGPSTVADQSIPRMREPISPPPWRNGYEDSDSPVTAKLCRSDIDELMRQPSRRARETGGGQQRWLPLAAAFFLEPVLDAELHDARRAGLRRDAAECRRGEVQVRHVPVEVVRQVEDLHAQLQVLRGRDRHQ